MLKTVFQFLFFTVICLALFAAINQLSGPFLSWFTRLAGVSQIVVFGMAGSLLWLLAAGLTGWLIMIGRRLQITASFIKVILFGLCLLQFGLLILPVWNNIPTFNLTQVLTSLACFIMVAELTIYPLFILPTQLKSKFSQSN